VRRRLARAAVPNVRAKQTIDKLRISAKGCIAAPAPKGSRRPNSGRSALHSIAAIDRCLWEKRVVNWKGLSAGVRRSIFAFHRHLVVLLGGIATAWPFVARSQKSAIQGEM
jgi:hypothetical protein